MRKLFEGFCHTVRALFGLVEGCAKWTIGELPPLRTWRSENGKGVLVGDATHAAEGVAQAIEDAAVLGGCLSRIKTLHDLSAAVAAYEAIGKPICERVQRIIKGNEDMLVLPDGPEQEDEDMVCEEMTEAYEKDLREVGREGIRTKPKPEPDVYSPKWARPGTRMWLYGYDAVEEVREMEPDTEGTLAKMMTGTKVPCKFVTLHDVSYY